MSCSLLSQGPHDQSKILGPMGTALTSERGSAQELTGAKAPSEDPAVLLHIEEQVGVPFHEEK